MEYQESESCRGKALVMRRAGKERDIGESW